MSARLLAIFALAGLAFAACGPARAADATVTAAMAPEGYARIVFSFDRLPTYEAKLVNGILVVTFDEAVKTDLSPVSRALGAIVNVVRRDPDNQGLRIALSKPARLSVNEAGDKLFLDLLPTSWTGTPPPLPKDVVAALGREAREARALKAEEERRRLKPKTPLDVTGAVQPTFFRLTFKVEDDVSVAFKRLGDTVAVTFGANLGFDLPRARALLPKEVADLAIVRSADTLTINLPAPAARDVRGFRDDGAYVLDIDRGEQKSAAAAPAGASGGHDAEHGPAAAPPRPPLAQTEPKPQPAPAPAPPAKTEAVVAPPASAPPATMEKASASAAPSVVKSGETIRLVFPFVQPTPAAVFRRGKTLWAVFDTATDIPLDALVRNSGGLIIDATQTALDKGRVLRLTLSEARLVTVSIDGSSWIVSLGEDVAARSVSLEVKPTFWSNGRSAIAIDAPGLGSIHQLRDPEAGDMLTVATLAGPARGLPRPQQFVEFSVLATAQGVAVSPIADDLHVNGEVDRILIKRDTPLALSMVDPGAPGASSAAPAATAILSGAAEDATKPFNAREKALLQTAAMAPQDERTEARLSLARFYQLRGRPADAKAVVVATMQDDTAAERDPRAVIMLAASNVMLDRPSEALALLAKPAFAASPEAALWRAAALADLDQKGPAREALRAGGPALGQLSGALQSRFVELALSLALDAGDKAQALARFEQLEALPPESGGGARELMRARVAEANGDVDKALMIYAGLAKGAESANAAEAELRSIKLGVRAGKISRDDAITRLDRLVTGWRGDWVEAEALADLVDLYGDVERWRDAFTTLKTAVGAFPDAESSRALQDKMQERFVNLFLGGGLDRMSKLDALALFYDFQEMSPGGKRGDELVRRLADKLVDVDLLDQASTLLDYQIDNRLTGAARAQVAARAALVNLMNNKPAKAVEVLRRTRQADLPASLADARLVLEARALAMSGRTDLALEIADGVSGDEGDRLAADMLWTARRWPEAGERIEALLGSAWKDPKPLNSDQRTQVMRAAIALQLAGDAIGVDRLRGKYAPKMADGPEAQSFDVVTAPVEIRGDAFRDIARSVATSSTFEAFLREYRARSAEELATDKTASEARGKA